MSDGTMNLSIKFSLYQNVVAGLTRMRTEARALGNDGKNVAKHFDEMAKSLKNATIAGAGFLAVYKKILKPGVAAAGNLMTARTNLGMELGKMSDADRNKIVNQLAAKAAVVQATAPMSQSDVLNLMTGLKKGGLSPKQLLAKGGPVEAAAGLATIAEDITPEVAGTALPKIATPFNMPAEKYADMVDQLQRYASSAPTNITEMLEAAQYAVGGLTALKADFADLPKLGAALALRGKTGSNAGTSMRAFYTSLMNPSTDGKKMMKKFGLDFFDDSGIVISAEKMSKQLKEKLGNLNPEQLGLVLNKIFDVRGMDTALALMQEGDGSLQKINADAAQQLTLWEKITERMKDYNAQSESAAGNWETIKGGAFLPLVNSLAKAGAVFNNRVFSPLVDATKDEGSSFSTVASYGTAGVAAGLGAATIFYAAKALSHGGSALRGLSGLAGSLGTGIVSGAAVKKAGGADQTVFVVNWPTSMTLGGAGGFMGPLQQLPGKGGMGASLLKGGLATLALGTTVGAATQGAALVSDTGGFGNALEAIKQHFLLAGAQTGHALGITDDKSYNQTLKEIVTVLERIEQGKKLDTVEVVISDESVRNHRRYGVHGHGGGL